MRKLNEIVQNMLSLKNEFSHEVGKLKEKYSYFKVLNVKQQSNVKFVGQYFPILGIDINERNGEIQILNHEGRRFLLDHVKLMNEQEYLNREEEAKVFSLDEYRKRAA